MNDSKALAVLEQAYGGIDDFAYAVLTDPNMKVALDETQSLVMRAEAVGLPLKVFSRVLNTPAFKAALRTSLVNAEFGFYDEQRHVQEIVKVATGQQRTVMSPRGNIGLVDPGPSDIIAAGRYLNDLRGTTVDGKGLNGGASVNIQIVNANAATTVGAAPGDAGREGEAVTVDAAAVAYAPKRAGGLPPRGVRERGSAATPAQATTPLLGGSGSRPQRHGDDGLAALTGFGEAPARGVAEQLEADALSRVRSPVAVGVDDRRRAWDELPNRRAPAAPEPLGRYSDD